MAKVIILDDEPAVCEAIAFKLEQDGHEVRVSQTGSVAIDYGYLFEPDVLVTDWQLQNDYDGLEVADALRHVHSKIRTILITGFPDENLTSKLETSPVFSTILKPFSLREISEAVRQAASAEDD